MPVKLVICVIPVLIMLLLIPTKNEGEVLHLNVFRCPWANVSSPTMHSSMCLTEELECDQKPGANRVNRNSKQQKQQQHKNKK